MITSWRQSASQTVLTVAEEKIASGYRKMLKMCIPQEAVHHKMQRDEVSQKIIVAVLGQDSRRTVEYCQLNKTRLPFLPKTSSLTDDEESLASQYRKDAQASDSNQVLQRMKKEGIEERSSLLSLASNCSNLGLSKPRTTRGNKLVSLHWTPLSGKALDKSVWNASKKQNVASTQPEGSDISKLVELFQKKTNVNASKDKKIRRVCEFDGESQTLDLTRSNNVAISLKAFREFTNKLREIIAFLDPTRRLGDRVEFLRDLLPLRQ
jgi:hypothetical protein